MTEIRLLDAAGAEGRLSGLAALLVDAVAGGASVNFLAGFTHAEAEAFWRTQLPGLACGERHLLVALDAAGELVGTVVLTLAQQPNAPHRAEVGKMLVHTAVRLQGLGRRLLAAAEDTARRHGRTLLMLDTEADSAGERLYRACGWVALGVVPDHALRPDGRLAGTTVLYKRISQEARLPEVTGGPGR